MRKQNGWRHALDWIATAKEKTLAGGATESRVDDESTAGLGGARVDEELLWDDLANTIRAVLDICVSGQELSRKALADVDRAVKVAKPVCATL